MESNLDLMPMSRLDIKKMADLAAVAVRVVVLRYRSDGGQGMTQ